MKGPHDHDARSALAKGKAAHGEQKRARAVARLRTRAAQAAAVTASIERPTDLGRPVIFEAPFAPRTRVLALSTPRLEVGGRVLLTDLDLALERGRHVHLAGPNGAGKSTLLRALVRASTLPPERLLLLPQELDDAAGLGLLARLHALPPEERGRVLQAVAALGLAPDQLLRTTRPSPGEARKLAVAFGLGGEAWAMVLDEPTNHLDLPSIERLERALAAYSGALLLVDHDERFARACCGERWRIGQARVVVEGMPAEEG